MSLSSSRDKYRLFNKGSSFYSVDSFKEQLPLDRSMSTPNLLQQPPSTPSTNRVDPSMLVSRRSEFSSTPKSTKTWLSTFDSIDVFPF